MSKHRKVSAHHHENLKEHAKALVRATSHITENNVAEARNRLIGWIETVGEVVETAEEKTVETIKQADTYVRENPYRVLAIAAGVGVLTGLLLRRNKD